MNDNNHDNDLLIVDGRVGGLFGTRLFSKRLRVWEDLNKPGYRNRFTVCYGLEWLEIVEANRYRDGGTTIINTNAGKIRIPRKLGIPEDQQMVTFNDYEVRPA